MQHFELRMKEPKWPFLGQNVIFWPFCDFWTVQSTVPSCTIRTVPKFQNDGLTPSFTASTVRPYFDGPYRHTVIAQPCKYYNMVNIIRISCVCDVAASLGVARIIYIRCIYGIFGREITKCTVIYGAYIRFWPTLCITHTRTHTCLNLGLVINLIALL